MELKVGDRVTGNDNIGFEAYKNDYTGIVVDMESYGATVKREDGVRGSGDWINGYGNGWLINKLDGKWKSSGTSGKDITINGCEQDVIINNKPMEGCSMSLIQKMKLALMGEPEKTLTKAGVIDSCGNLTCDGKDLFMAYLFTQSKQAFTDDVVAKIVVDQEKK